MFLKRKNIVNLKKIDINLISKISNKCLKKQNTIVEEILRYNSDMVDFVAEEERAFPGNKNFLETGYYKTMLKRYFFAGNYFCKNKEVLDTCSGMGWGTYMISQYANKVIAFDMDNNAVDFCKANWKSRNIDWMIGDSLDLSFLKEKKFDVALGMETIEHFSKPDGERYVAQIASVLKRDGFFIGTSSFPIDRKSADDLCSTNPYHLHIFTYDEMDEILEKYFTEYTIVNNWMFIAKK